MINNKLIFTFQPTMQIQGEIAKLYLLFLKDKLPVEKMYIDYYRSINNRAVSLYISFKDSYVLYPCSDYYIYTLLLGGLTKRKKWVLHRKHEWRTLVSKYHELVTTSVQRAKSLVTAILGLPNR